MKLIEELPPVSEMQPENNESDTTLAINESNVKSCIVADEVMVELDDAEGLWIDAVDCSDIEVKVAIIDAMAVVQGIKEDAYYEENV